MQINQLINAASFGCKYESDFYGKTVVLDDFENQLDTFDLKKDTNENDNIKSTYCR